MKWIDTSADIPIKSWCADTEAEAMDQAVNLANHPTTFHHVALMPDCHTGYGMPIGGVIACKNAIIPNAVGVDIGCGMGAVKTSFKAQEINRGDIQKIIDRLHELIPVGFDHQDENQEWEGFDEAPDIKVVRHEIVSARKQLGTLGGGNHFIELQAGDDGYVWLMLHSGSRNLGYKIAKTYNARAQKLCKLWHSKVGPFDGEDGLAFFPVGTPEAGEYIDAMKFAMRFAQQNRAVMMNHFKTTVQEFLDCEFEQEINIHHNFAALERHFDEKVWVHRKGATQAEEGQLGIIPGSMGTSSYIVRGLGNAESFNSCSHGAGRNMSRTKFCKTHSVKECNDALGDVVFNGWKKDKRGRVDISEAPQAYKDIDLIIEDESDLVEVVVKLRPLGVMKG